MRDRSEILARIDELERLCDYRQGKDVEHLVREIAVLRWVLGDSGALNFVAPESRK